MNAQSKYGQLTFDTGLEVAVETTEQQPVRVARVIPDLPALDKAFDYAVPETWGIDKSSKALQIGSMVRIPFGGRQINGWVLELDVKPVEGINLLPISKLRSIGPSSEVVELAQWAAERWVGRLGSFLTTASPPKNIPILKERVINVNQINKPTENSDLIDKAFKSKKAVLRLPPASNLLEIAYAVGSRGNTLILFPSVAGAQTLARKLRKKGIEISIVPEEWEKAATGGSVIGSRSAAFAPIKDISAVLVFDEHDTSYKEERVPTWNARDVAVERARRNGVPCLLSSACPTLEALSWGELFKPSRKTERDGWPILELIDRRGDDPTRSGLLSERLASVLRDKTGPVVCVLNRKGRSRLLACNMCGTLALCETHRIPLNQNEKNYLQCSGGCPQRPIVCDSCGSTKFKNLRAGIARLREELEALTKEEVIEVTSESKNIPLTSRVYIGTEAVLHRVKKASQVVFLEFDQELLAPNFRVAEHALALLVRASKLLGDRDAGGRLLVQTRQPDNEVLQSVLHADPEILSVAETERRKILSLPPYSALAQISGNSAESFISSLEGSKGIEILGPRNGNWLLRSDSREDLAKVLKNIERPKGRVRIEIDPLRA